MSRDELRRLAEKATPGPWVTHVKRSPEYVYCDDGLGSAVLSTDGLTTPLIDCAQKQKNVAYAAAANPATILELLDTVDELVGALESSPCPYPVGGLDTVKECIEGGKCGCDNQTALARAKEKQ